jgi:hypothetical protein
MIVPIVILYLLSALLPLAGLTLLAVTARRALATARDAEPRNASGPKIAIRSADSMQIVPVGNIASAAEQAATLPTETWRQVRRDFLLIGGGVVCGVIAGVWSLFI